jgi:hypothetical protein
LTHAGDFLRYRLDFIVVMPVFAEVVERKPDAVYGDKLAENCV